MGGRAFAQPGAGPDEPALKVPRLSPVQYRALRDDYYEELKKLYSKVGTPAEAPGKQDHGDIDFIVEGPLTQLDDSELSGIFKARRYIRNGVTRNLAVPLSVEDETYAQIDVHVCPPNIWEWMMLFHAYSDLFMIIGISHRSLGITINDKGLFVRIEEIEPANRKQSHVFLTDSPDGLLRFLGLDRDRYDAGFETENDLFDWVASGRFLNTRLDKLDTKTKDRHHLKDRPMIRRFFDEWLPTHADMGNGRHQWTREEVLLTSLEAFGVQDAYDKKLIEHRAINTDRKLWSQIAACIPLEGLSKGVTIRGLKRWTLIENGRITFRQTPVVDLDQRSMWPVGGVTGEEILEWVKANWEEAKTKEKERIKREKNAPT